MGVAYANLISNDQLLFWFKSDIDISNWNKLLIMQHNGYFVQFE